MFHNQKLFQQPRQRVLKKLLHLWIKHHFQPTKTRPLPPKNQSSNPPRPKNPSPRLVGRIGGIRITGLHLGYPPYRWRAKIQPMVPWKNNQMTAQIFQFPKYFGWGGCFWKIETTHFSMKLPVFGGSENLMVGD